VGLWRCKEERARITRATQLDVRGFAASLRNGVMQQVRQHQYEALEFLLYAAELGIETFAPRRQRPTLREQWRDLLPFGLRLADGLRMGVPRRADLVDRNLQTLSSLLERPETRDIKRKAA